MEELEVLKHKMEEEWKKDEVELGKKEEERRELECDLKCHKLIQDSLEETFRNSKQEECFLALSIQHL